MGVRGWHKAPQASGARGGSQVAGWGRTVFSWPLRSNKETMGGFKDQDVMLRFALSNDGFSVW